MFLAISKLMIMETRISFEYTFRACTILDARVTCALAAIFNISAEVKVMRAKLQKLSTFVVAY